MNTKERREELNLASRLRRLAGGKRAHARNCRATAERKREEAEKINALVPDFDGLPNFLRDLNDGVDRFFKSLNPDRKTDDEKRAEIARLEDEAAAAEAEAEKAEAAAAAAEAEAEQAELRAIGGG